MAKFFNLNCGDILSLGYLLSLNQTKEDEAWLRSAKKGDTIDIGYGEVICLGETEDLDPQDLLDAEREGQL